MQLVERSVATAAKLKFIRLIQIFLNNLQQVKYETQKIYPQYSSNSRWAAGGDQWI
jgi:hypothetical protein